MERDRELTGRLRAGDERAFAEVVDRWHARLLALARTFCRTDSVAEEAVQETWLALIQGIRRFEGRGSLRSWLFAILANRARTLAVRERRMAGAAPAPAAPAPSAEDEGDDLEPGMHPSGRWETPPTPWGLEDPASALLSRETLAVVSEAIDGLPDGQRRVLLLRDVEGLEAAEVCNILEISETNQRVLLHRGRARVRRALDRYVKEGARAESRPARRGGAASE